MENIDPPPHTALAAAANMLSYPLREPVIRTQPKVSNCIQTNSNFSNN